MTVEDILYAPLLISYDTSKSSHPWVALRGPIYIYFHETMRIRLPNIFTNTCFALTLNSAKRYQRMETQLPQNAGLLVRRGVLRNFPHHGSNCIFNLSYNLANNIMV